MNKLTLSLDLYDLETIKESINDFKEVCDIQFNINEGEAVLTIPEEKSEESEIIQGEFCNYVLNKMKNKGLV
ncbi:MAG: HxsD-like protein [Candidatus Woesearchaeota archaeon]